METQFNNVTISIVAKDSKEAYTKLCNALDTLRPNVEWRTDTYQVEGSIDRSTAELFPKSK